MSVPRVDLLFGPYKKTELVKKITTKTQEGKIVWQRTGNGTAAYVPGALRMNFVDAPWALLAKRWVLFVVRDEPGNELLKVENQSSAPPETGIAPPYSSLFNTLVSLGDPLVNAVTELHNVVQSQEGKGSVDKAIAFLDNM